MKLFKVAFRGCQPLAPPPPPPPHPPKEKGTLKEPISGLGHGASREVRNTQGLRTPGRKMPSKSSLEKHQCRGRCCHSGILASWHPQGPQGGNPTRSTPTSTTLQTPPNKPKPPAGRCFSGCWSFWRRPCGALPTARTPQPEALSKPAL